MKIDEVISRSIDESALSNLNMIRMWGNKVGNKLAGLFSRKKKARADVIRISMNAFKAFNSFLGRRRDISMENVPWKVVWIFMISPQGLKMDEDSARAIIKNRDLKSQVEKEWRKIANEPKKTAPTLSEDEEDSSVVSSAMKNWGKPNSPVGGTNKTYSEQFTIIALTYIFEIAATQYLELSTDAMNLTPRQIKWLNDEGISLPGSSFSREDQRRISAAINRGIQGDEDGAREVIDDIVQDAGGYVSTPPTSPAASSAPAAAPTTPPTSASTPAAPAATPTTPASTPTTPAAGPTKQATTTAKVDPKKYEEMQELLKLISQKLSSVK